MKILKVSLLVMLIAAVASVVYAHEGYQGCTPGYWKNHPDSWVGYSPDDLFSEVFGRVITIGSDKKAITDPTLMEALNGNGGGVTALARHAVAGILNASHPNINYPRTVGTIIYYVVCEGLDWGEPWITLRKDRLDEWNNLGCPENDGTLVNGTTFALGKVGEAFSFYGVDDDVWATGTGIDDLTLTEEGLKNVPEAGTDLAAFLANDAPEALVLGNVGNGATHTPISGTLTVAVVGQPMLNWEDDEGITHYCGLPAAYEFLSGDLAGTGGSMVNVNIDPLTGNGDESGASMFNVTWGELSGTLEGRLSATYTAGFSTGTAVYHGVSGDFKGIKLMMSYILDTTTGPAGTPWLVTYQAIVLDPHSGRTN